MGRLAILIATVLWVGGASAQTLDIDRMSDADFKKLTPEQTKTLPAFKMMQRFDPQMERGMRAFVPLLLRNLGYGFREAFTGSDEQLQRWVMQFQHDTGQPETGALTFGQMDTLSERHSPYRVRAREGCIVRCFQVSMPEHLRVVGPKLSLSVELSFEPKLCASQ